MSTPWAKGLDRATQLKVAGVLRLTSEFARTLGYDFRDAQREAESMWEDIERLADMVARTEPREEESGS